MKIKGTLRWPSVVNPLQQSKTILGTSDSKNLKFQKKQKMDSHKRLTWCDG